MKITSILVAFMIMLCGCEAFETNPAAEGFNTEQSDPKAIEIADAVMEASGGRAVWDNTNYLEWRFFGNRLHTWNKTTGDLVIESAKDSFVYKMNLNTMAGDVILNGEKLGPTEKESYIKRAKEYWINDSYWIFLPYKLKDSGVTLKHLGDGESGDGQLSDLLELTFTGVGVTPENKYVVYVDKETNLICQWDFYKNSADKKPMFSSPWRDYQDFNGLKLSASRGEGRGMQDIAVGESLAAKFQ